MHDAAFTRYARFAMKKVYEVPDTGTLAGKYCCQTASIIPETLLI
jgi:hypothetical protein